MSSDPREMIPEFPTESEPYSLMSVIPSAQAAIGNANAKNAKTNTRLILISSKILLPFEISPNFHLKPLHSRCWSARCFYCTCNSNRGSCCGRLLSVSYNRFARLPVSRNAICCTVTSDRFRRSRDPRCRTSRRVGPPTRRNNCVGLDWAGQSRCERNSDLGRSVYQNPGCDR